MAIARVQGVVDAGMDFSGSPGVDTLTLSAPATVGNLVVVAISAFLPVASVVMGSNTFERSRDQTSGNGTDEIWHSIITEAGTVITITLTGEGFPGITCTATEFAGFTGRTTATVLDTANSASPAAATSHASGNVTTTVADALLFALGHAFSEVWTAGDGAFTSEHAGSAWRMEHRILSATGTHGWTGSTAPNPTDSNVILTAFKGEASASRRWLLGGR